MMGVKQKLANWLIGDEVRSMVSSEMREFKYDVPGKEQTLDKLAMFRQKEYAVWASGNPIDLLKFYGHYKVVPGEQDGSSRMLFWEWVFGVNNVPKLHYPAPEIIMNQMKSLIFAEDLDIEVSIKNKVNVKKTKELWDILDDNNINELYQTGVMYETYSGSLAFRFVYNTDVSDLPIIIPYPAERFKLRSILGKVQEIIFEDEYKVGDKKFLLKSHYGKGYINYKLWTNDSADKRKQVPLETVPELEEGYKDIIITVDGETPIPFMLACYKKNRSSSNEFAGTQYGGSDFEGLTDTFNMIDELYSQKNLYIRRARPMITMSDRIVPKDSRGREVLPKEYELDTLVIHGEETKENIKPERDLPDLNVSFYDESIKNELKTCFSKIGLAYTTVGLEAHSANISGAALEMKEKSTVIVRSNKIKLWDNFLQNVFRVLFIYKSLATAKEQQDDRVTTYYIPEIQELDFNIEFPVYNSQTFDELVNESTKALGIVFDQKRAVEHALRNYSEDERAEIVKNIKIEQGVALIGDEISIEE